MRSSGESGYDEFDEEVQRIEAAIDLYCAANKEAWVFIEGAENSYSAFCRGLRNYNDCRTSYDAARRYHGTRQFEAWSVEKQIIVSRNR